MDPLACQSGRWLFVWLQNFRQGVVHCTYHVEHFLGFAPLGRKVIIPRLSVTSSLFDSQRRAYLNGFYISKDYPEHFHRIRLKDHVSGKTIRRVRNNRGEQQKGGTSDQKR